MMTPKYANPPTTGEIIRLSQDRLQIPNHPIIPFIEGDGIGPDIWRAAKQVLDSAIEHTYQGTKQIHWMEIYAGEKAYKMSGEWLPEETPQLIQDYFVAIKGPLTTPVGGGIRSLNVSLRQILDLYACIRPVRYIEGVPSPVKHPERLDVIIFRENTEDVYAGIEWESNSSQANRLIGILQDDFGCSIREKSGIGIKPISPYATKRLVRKAIRYAMEHKLPTVTLVHKGNIMKYTEGAFRDWGYQLAKAEFPDEVITEQELWDRYNGEANGKIVIKDRIADAMFQQVLLRPDEYHVIVTPNLNGDYLSDACAAQVGGLGMAPGANISDYVALFEATHGTAPKYAGQNKVNPNSLILSGVMMLDYLGWNEAANRIVEAIRATIEQKTVTYDLERQMEGATKVSTSGFADAIVGNL